MMATNPQMRGYPVAYFLHAHLANPKILQKILGTPHLLKLRKASIPGYIAADNSTVVSAGYGFGEWHDEARLKGVVHYVSDESEEQKLQDFVCSAGGVEVREVEFEVVVSGIWGRKEWVRGLLFERAEKEREDGVTEEMVDQGKGKQRAEEMVEDEMEAEEEEDKGTMEPDDYKNFYAEDEMVMDEELVAEPDAYNPLSAEDETTPPNAIVAAQRPFPTRTSSLGHLKAYQTTPPPDGPQHNPHEQDTTPCAGLEHTTLHDQAKSVIKDTCDPPGPHIASTTDHDSGVVKSLVAMYDNLGL